MLLDERCRPRPAVIWPWRCLRGCPDRRGLWGAARSSCTGQRLRECRLVAFVVAVSPVADEIDQEIATESRAILPRHPRGFEARDRIVGVDVDDRNLEAARQPARVARAVGLGGRCRKSELVVGDDVNRAAGVVAGKPRQVQRFSDDSLSRETRRRRESASAASRRRSNTGGPGSRRARAGGARHSFDHRIHRFEMARVRHQRQEHLAARARRPRARVILHVAAPAEIEAHVLRAAPDP